MSFNLLADTLLSSQESDLGDDDLLRMVESSESTNTKRTTSWGFKKLIKWLDRRNIQIDFKSVTEEKLCETLRKFSEKFLYRIKLLVYQGSARQKYFEQHNEMRVTKSGIKKAVYKSLCKSFNGDNIVSKRGRRSADMLDNKTQKRKYIIPLYHIKF